MLGLLGYVGGRMTLAPSEVVVMSTYVMLAGIALGALVIAAHASRTRRPLVLRLFATVCVLYGVLTVLYPYSRAVANPEAALTVVAIVLLAIGWKDLSDPTLWRTMPPNRK